MSKTIKISGKILPLDTVRFMRPVDDAERQRISERYGVDGATYNTSIQFGDKSSKLTSDTIDAIREAGVSLVNVGNDRFVPAANIKSAEPFTKADAEKAQEKGYTIANTYRSRVETTAGQVLSSAHPSQVMERRAKALGLKPA